MTLLSTFWLCVIPLLSGSLGYIWGWRINCEPGSEVFTWSYLGYSIAAALVSISTVLGGLLQYFILCAALRRERDAANTLLGSVVSVASDARRLAVFIPSLLLPIFTLPFIADSPLLTISLFVSWSVGAFCYLSWALLRERRALGL